VKCGLSGLAISDERYSEARIKYTSTYVYKDHLSLETTVGCSMSNFSDTNTLLYMDHQFTETTVTQFLDLLFQTHLLYSIQGLVYIYCTLYRGLCTYICDQSFAEVVSRRE
jgi:hypothetical protein